MRADLVSLLTASIEGDSACSGTHPPCDIVNVKQFCGIVAVLVCFVTATVYLIRRLMQSEKVCKKGYGGGKSQLLLTDCCLSGEIRKCISKPVGALQTVPAMLPSLRVKMDTNYSGAAHHGVLRHQH